jgi:glutamate-1-semialdehyde 2,1-aminomutase
MDANQKLYEDACRFIPGGVNTSIRRMEPHLVFTQAHGAVMTDANGREYIDYQAAFGPLILGHNHAAVNARVMDVMSRLDLTGTGTLDIEIDLARKIVQHVPSAERVLFCNSGSEATYQALRLARAATGRTKIVKFQGCYHGWHDAVAKNIITAPARMGTSDPASAGSLSDVLDKTLVCRFNDLDDVERMVNRNAGEVAAIILEPIPHNIGCVMPKQSFLEGLRELTRVKGIVLIFDEVITGFRHGLSGYQGFCGVTPDLTALGKAMANGYPIAAVCGSQHLMERYNTQPGGDVLFAGTYNGHAMCCAAALATIEELEKPEVFEHIVNMGARMRNGLDEILSRQGIAGVVAGFRSVFLTYFMEGPIESYDDVLRNDERMFVEYRRRLLDHGIFKLPMNLKRACVGASHTTAHIDHTLQVCEDVLQKLSSGRTAMVPSGVS